MNRPGFSLVELVMVMAILAVMAAIAIPRYAQAAARYRAALAAHRVVVDLALARDRARSSSTSRTITFDLAAHRYSMVHGLTAAIEAVVELDLAPYAVTIESADFGGDAVVKFNGYGQPDSGGVVQVRCGDTWRSVVLDAASGEAVVP